MLTKAKAAFLVSSLVRRIVEPSPVCPHCGSKELSVVQRKQLVLELKECLQCKMMFLHPFGNSEKLKQFYQTEYNEGLATDLPSDEELPRMLKRGFRNQAGDYAVQIGMLQALGAKSGDKILEFGSSWGYGCWQMQEAGFKVQGFEISKPRAKFGREKLSLNLVDEFSNIDSGIDFFLSYHVLEHVPDVPLVLNLARKILKPGGFCVLITPNGSSSRRALDPKDYHKIWGQVHPNVFSDEYYLRAFPNGPLLLTSPPYPWDTIRNWDRRSRQILDVSGWELCALIQL